MTFLIINDWEVDRDHGSLIVLTILMEAYVLLDI